MWCDWGCRQRKRERETRVCNEDELEARGEGRREELGEDGSSDSAEADERHGDRAKGDGHGGRAIEGWLMALELLVDSIRGRGWL